MVTDYYTVIFKAKLNQTFADFKPNLCLIVHVKISLLIVANHFLDLLIFIFLSDLEVHDKSCFLNHF